MTRYFSQFVVIWLSEMCAAHQPTYLYEDGKEEKESLVHGGQVDPGVERDQEDELHQEGGVDEDVGEAEAQSDQHTGGRTFFWRVDDSLKDSDVMIGPLFDWDLPNREPRNNPSSRTCSGIEIIFSKKNYFN